MFTHWLHLLDAMGNTIMTYAIHQNVMPWEYRPSIPIGVIIWGIRIEEVPLDHPARAHPNTIKESL